jgi:hypothetical protein
LNNPRQVCDTGMVMSFLMNPIGCQRAAISESSME